MHRFITEKIITTSIRVMSPINNKQGMEMVQVAILVAIAIAIGLIFKSSITEFVNKIFNNLDAANF